ncbi:sodium/proton-translocating pyrophosphatase [Candidatus Saccharibacteria bacterium]|nr:sodium/proton-translocating pyrophosphatase [Candidatus Saccharibacteria bacterium]
MATVYTLSLVVVFCTFILIARNFIDLKNHDEGTLAMRERAEIIRSGAKTFMRRQDKAILYVLIAMTIAIVLIKEPVSAMCFVFGAILVRFAVEIGMRGGTYGNVRTANAARVTGALSRTLRIAMLSGSISGFSAMAFGIFGFVIISVVCWRHGASAMAENFLTHTEFNLMESRLMSYGLGFSMIAIFNRVAGGVYTKMADIGNDIVSKSDFGLEEDDPRNICSIADLIGDCLNDLAGNLSDLGESFVSTIMSCTVIAVQQFAYDPSMLSLAIAFPLIIVNAGLIGSVIGVMYVVLKNRKRFRITKMSEEEFFTKYPNESKRPRHRKLDDGQYEVQEEYSLAVDDPGKELNAAMIFAAAITLGVSLLAAKWLFADSAILQNFGLKHWIAPWLSALFGVGISVTVGILTKIYTEPDQKYVKRITKMAPHGAAFVVLEGMFVGNHSAFIPQLLLALQILGTFLLCGMYGIGIAGVGVLAFVAETMSVDAFGPVADNAGGIAESCGLGEKARAITDRCDAEGNTTAAVGKGNAISAAAASTVTTTMTFLGSIPSYDLNAPLSIVKMIAGMIIGSAILSEFLATLNNNTTSGAWDMSEMAQKELKDPDVMNGKRLPDYNQAIAIASDTSLSYMLKPAMLAVIPPLLVGAVFGPIAQLGLILGETVIGIREAFYNGNAGGAWDNAKKSIEMGKLEGHGKHSLAHLAAIIGDMIGDVLKDVLAPNCDIIMKITAVVCALTVNVFFVYHIF